jgi:hypothetical protein
MKCEPLYMAPHRALVIPYGKRPTYGLAEVAGLQSGGAGARVTNHLKVAFATAVE